jgi:hypothetical protein
VAARRDGKQFSSTGECDEQNRNTEREASGNKFESEASESSASIPSSFPA